MALYMAYCHIPYKTAFYRKGPGKYIENVFSNNFKPTGNLEKICLQSSFAGFILNSSISDRCQR